MTTTKTPVVGEFATYGIGGDSYPVEIIAVTPSLKTVTTRSAEVVQYGARAGLNEIDGQPEGSFDALQNLDGTIRKFRLNKRGSYTRTGGYGYLALGVVSNRLDPSF